MCAKNSNGCCWISTWIGGLYVLACIYCHTIKK
jgi:hypothetical protein